MNFTLTVSFEAWPTAAVATIVFILAPIVRGIISRIINSHHNVES